ncbi:MAG: hypothetical protein R2734_00660 [Nocardioides sp.]
MRRPGRKAALLAGLAAEQGAADGPGERQPHQAGLVRRALAGAPGATGVVVADGTRPPWAPGTFDRVLVDAPSPGSAPCGGVRSPGGGGVGGPDRAGALQRALLASAADLVRPGGVLLYATCSPVLAETAEVVSEVLADRPDLVLEDVTAALPGVPDCAGPLPGTAQLWPHRHGTDAMFLAQLRRSEPFAGT